MTSVLLGFADDLIAEDDLYLSIVRSSLDGHETGFFGSVRIQAIDVTLELAHEEKDPDDRKRPQDEYSQKESLIGRHEMKSRV